MRARNTIVSVSSPSKSTRFPAVSKRPGSLNGSGSTRICKPHRGGLPAGLNRPAAVLIGGRVVSVGMGMLHPQPAVNKITTGTRILEEPSIFIAYLFSAAGRAQRVSRPGSDPYQSPGTLRHTRAHGKKERSSGV